MRGTSFGGNAIVADDRAAIRDAVRMALGSTWCIFPAGSGVEAVFYARSILAELVILDLKMRPMNGLEAAAAIRRLPGYGRVPLVMLTAFDSEENRERARCAGVDAIVAKPFTGQALVSLVRPLIGGCAEAPRALDSHRHVEAQNILAVCRKVELAGARTVSYDGFAGWMKARRRDSVF